MPAKTKPPASTQEHLNIAAIRNGVIILKNGELRQILLASALNFALKSTQEQDGLVLQYQNFLNSLHFPIQIIIQSRKLDLNPYLDQLKERAKNETSPLLKLQITDYVDFVSRLIDVARVMDKTFLVVVPLMPPTLQKEGFAKRLLGIQGQVRITSEEFRSLAQQLEERTRLVVSGLSGLGIKAALLDTYQALQLFYNIYNPEEAYEERLVSPETLKADVIKLKTQNEKRKTTM